MDKEWYVERKIKEESKLNVNHKGLMPKCFNCNSSYKFVPSDKEDFPFKAEHATKCPFGVVIYGESDINCIAQIRVYNNKMIEARSSHKKRDE